MTNKIKMFLLSFLSTITFVSGSLATVAYAQEATSTTDRSTSTGAINCGSTGDLTGQNCQPTSSADAKINNTVKLSIQVFQVIVGLVSVFMLIAAGLKYITSGGDSSGVGAAKNMILYAVVGLVVVALAQVVVAFVLNRVDATPTTNI
jgi:hypothetical protein